MTIVGRLATVLLVFGLCATRSYASDPMGLYARVDRVVLEPNPDAPKAIQIWGVFALATPGSGNNDYGAPVRGYLYFTMSDNATATVAEWADLKAVAGSGRIVSFGSRHQLKARVRQADEEPTSPDPYVVSFGLMRTRDDSGNPPVRALLAFPR